ncbi:MAG: hypothetical protein A3K19_14560 [Lentisphaerae bacterium RIFOXYB12_FULL_65_16]|nr:MAG: hypothetical protein A3K18_18605 [Lentisphaerae bacterium RIFOXYA12_64_32]OGV87444.1 MAG: hypothetical protein A3K19_14560 [Lentisphaerae bacterium RIFOXYB12_FULL_65_16]
MSTSHACPVWVGYLLANPFRKLVHSPGRILGPYVSTGMWTLDVGCATGFFSLPLARLVGASGRVICVDVQPKLLEALRRRARRAGLAERLDVRLGGLHPLIADGLDGRVDFALAFAVVHEVDDSGALFSDVYALLKSGGQLLVAEPKGRVPEEEFVKTVHAAKTTGFAQVSTPCIAGTRAVLLSKG